ncbi:MAG: hypothetical protein NTU77_12110, partial [Actinobacteria bacterium]|nr:hypothetical protein [Actinomycetota bacterium]
MSQRESAERRTTKPSDTEETTRPEGRPVSFEHRALQVAFTAPRSSSFAEFLATAAPTALPSMSVIGDPGIHAPHGTTIVALRGDFGAVMAGDRRATMGNVIAQRDIEKVFEADRHSLIGIAGTAGLAIELVRL